MTFSSDSFLPKGNALNDLASELALERHNREKHEKEGVPALDRLVEVASGYSSQFRHVACFLLALYNYERFQFDLAALRNLDLKIHNDCMAVLNLDRFGSREVCNYCESGGKWFEQLAQRWELNKQNDHLLG